MSEPWPLCAVSLTVPEAGSAHQVSVTFSFLQESPDPLPDALQTHVLLQARGAAALQRLDQQQGRQAVLVTLSKVVRLFCTLRCSPQGRNVSLFTPLERQLVTQLCSFSTRDEFHIAARGRGRPR